MPTCIFDVNLFLVVFAAIEIVLFEIVVGPDRSCHS